MQTTYGKNNRIEILDGLRGIAMLYVIFYHFIFDLIYFEGRSVRFFFAGWFEPVHSLFLALLFLVSGICTSFSRNTLKRGIILVLLGTGITFGSALFSPENIIVFGILSFFGWSMVLFDLSRKWFEKIPWIATLLLSVFLWYSTLNFCYGVVDLIVTKVHFQLPQSREYLYPLGLFANSFRSGDYFPLIPNFFIFLAGTALSRPIRENKLPKKFYTAKLPVIDFFGKHSLIIYLVHQPILLLVFYLV